MGKPVCATCGCLFLVLRTPQEFVPKQTTKEWTGVHCTVWYQKTGVQVHCIRSRSVHTCSAEASHGELLVSMAQEVTTLASSGFTAGSEERERKLRALLPGLISSIVSTRRLEVDSAVLTTRLVLDRQLFKKGVKLFEAIAGLVASEMETRPENLSLLVDILRSDIFFSVDMVKVN